MKTEFSPKKTMLIALVNDSLMDEEGKGRAVLLLEGFFAVLNEK